MRRIAASALLVGATVTAPASAASPADTAARALETDPVYVHPGAAARLTVPERGRVRLEIARSAIGRIKVVVVPAEVASRRGGVHQFSNQLDGALGARGTLITVAGADYWAVTSYLQAHAAAAALQTAVAAIAAGRRHIAAARERLG